MKLVDEHKDRKQVDYWQDLVAGQTSRYKEAQIARLLAEHYQHSCDRILDIGCGTCETVLRYKAKFGASLAACMDYDAKIIEQMRQKFPNADVRWIVSDILDLEKLEAGWDLVLLLDMLHELYSFCGRATRETDGSVSHDAGLRAVKNALGNVAKITNPGGGVIITDNVLCDSTAPVHFRTRSTEVSQALDFLGENYRPRSLKCPALGDGTRILPARDFCILLTQYNKVKNKDWERWNVERLEIHQYMTVEEYRSLFDENGMDMWHLTGTPEANLREYEEDFEIVSGLEGIPHKRLALLAIKRR